MKSFTALFWVCFAFFSFGLISLGWSQTDKLVPEVPPTETFFLKSSVGTFISEKYFDSYNRLIINGIHNQFDISWNGPVGQTGSIAAGIEYPDQFSVFLSGEGLSQDWCILLNAQKRFFRRSWAQLYFYGGAGLDINQNGLLGVAAQVGLGDIFQINSQLGLFVEVKCFATTGGWDPPFETQNYTWWDFYWPVSIGLKYNL